MLSLKNEYLFVIEKDKSAFYELCRTTANFNDFIQSNRLLKIKKNTIIYKNETYSYIIKQGDINNAEQRFFYLTLEFNREEKELKNYKELNRELKTIFTSKLIFMEILRDDISFHYSHKAYALLHKIENLMRKFITYFMVTKIGKEWFENYSPKEIERTINNSKRKTSSILEQLDFIHLGDFLFKSYHEGQTDELFTKIKSLDKDESLKKDELEKYISKSNWNKFFKDKIDCEEEYLNKRWKKLYDLRNKIAHTSTFTEGDFDEINVLVKEVKEKIEEAFNKISNIEINEEEKIKLSEDIIKSTNEYIGIFMEEWIKIEKKLRILTRGQDDKYIPINTACSHIEIWIEDNKFIQDIEFINNIKNKLVHGDLDFDTQPIPIKKLQVINSILEEHINSKTYLTYINKKNFPRRRLSPIRRDFEDFKF